MSGYGSNFFPPIGGGGGGGGDENAVSYNPQTGKTEAQKAQARANIGAEEQRSYASLTRRGDYLYDVSFVNIPPDSGEDIALLGGCSSFVKDGKLYRYFDWYYSELASFHVYCPGFEGIAFLNGLTNTEVSSKLIGQLPYHVVDGINDNGIMVSAHVLFNDWDWHGTANGIPLTRFVYHVLKNVTSMATLATELSEILPELCTTAEMDAAEYLAQFIVTDGITTCAILPPESSSGTYQIVDISENPKLTNFRWVNRETVTRSDADLQTRPTGIERWNMIPASSLGVLRFTVAYEEPTRLSEFIGENGTTKESTDEELEAIYDIAHEEYLTRTREAGTTWQTMHSIVYSASGVESLFVQENFARDYASGGGGGSVTPSGYYPGMTVGAADALIKDGEEYTITDIYDYVDAQIGDAIGGGY